MNLHTILPVRKHPAAIWMNEEAADNIREYDENGSYWPTGWTTDLWWENGAAYALWNYDGTDYIIEMRDYTRSDCVYYERQGGFRNSWTMDEWYVCRREER